ncbi:MAG TPA: hypothetical protein VLL52_02910, partial [Anaerolineae bacterium]|nr:hypothetical protein [Anaerolineae bacterium]
RRGGERPLSVSNERVGDGLVPARWWWGWLVGINLLFFVFNGLGVLRIESPLGMVAGVERPLAADFGGQILLLGVDGPAEVAAGETFEVTVYWQAQQSVDINYQSFIHMLAPDGFLVAQADKLNPSDFPTRRWPTDKYIRDSYEVDVPLGVAPGEYGVYAGLWVQAEGWRLPVWNDAGEQIGDNQLLYKIKVVDRR